MILPEPLHSRNQQPAGLKAVSFQELKSRIHRGLIERIDLAKLDLLRQGELAKEIGFVIEALIVEAGVPLSRQEKERLVVEVQHETFGLGPIEPLLAAS